LLIRVAVPVPALDPLTYAVPDECDPPPLGARVIVPLGARLVTGIVVEPIPDAPARGQIRRIDRVLDDRPFVPAEVVQLARWTAEYYAAGVGDTIPMLLPPMARGSRADAHKTIRVAAITPAGLEALAAVGGSVPTPRQREALELLAGSASGLAIRTLAARGISVDAVLRLARQGLVSVRHDRIDRDPFSGAAGGAAGAGGAPTIELATRQLTEEQAAAIERLRAIAATGAFRVALLHGVTGSGKTEIYLRLAAMARDGGRRALVLVPEISLTPAVAGQFRQAFAARVAIQHSGLSDGERHDQWQRIRRGDVDVVVGTRSAVFAPLERVGLIVVDEEHDPSYKQDEIPRYNGRDVAIVRGRRAGALVVLGSATPSMETYYNAMAGRYERVVLERRVFDRPLPAVTIVDMREEYAEAGPEVVLSRRLRAAVTRRLDEGEQALVLLNRRGFSTSVFCRQCAETLDCPNCSVSLVVHGEGAARRARCHYCNYATRLPLACPLCGGPFLEASGLGTQRLEAEVKKAWPGARVGRLDRDAIRRRGALAELLSRFRDGKIDVLVGTQMIAKGHDFPRVTLVGVISADVGLGLADFRASERTFQLLTQVAGRAGRGAQPGEALIQTLYPDHYSIRLACDQNYRAFYAREVKFREAMRYPPAVALVNVVVRASTFAGALDAASDLVQRLRRMTAPGPGTRVLGPAPAPIGRLRGEYRAQLLIKGNSRRRMREALQAALGERPDLQRRVVVDVDPISVL
jgi:primosomal protein N' (replication factor Y)